MTGVSQRAGQVQPPIIPIVADWIRAHPGTLSLGQGVVGYGPPPEAWEEMQRLRREPQLNRYQPVDGLPELVEALRLKLREAHGIRVGDTGDDPVVMVAAGSNSAFLQVILAVCDPGDEVILPVPYFFNQEMALTMTGVKPVPVRCGPLHQLDPEAIEAAITPRTRAVVTVSPNNPTGAVYSEDQLRAVNRLCAAHGLFHISDEAYEAFTFGGARHVSPGAFDGAGEHTISLFSFSKSHGFASWRTGYAVVPARLQGALRKIQDTNQICPPVVSQLGALGCLRAGPGWVAERLSELGRVRSLVLEQLRSVADRVEIGPAFGAFYVLLRVQGRAEPMEFTRRLISEHRIAVIPGTAFGLRDGCWLRMAYGALTPETALEGVGRFVEGLQALPR
jgi:aspartate/methionine/tyrosine aminotransferase